MPQCPQCSKPLVELTRQCPSCRADLDLLVDYVNGLQTNLSRAEQLTRVGELGPAVWAYLEVLEVDPDNPAARHQVGQVATAVRQFDRTAPGRRWAQGLPPGKDGPGFNWAGLLKGFVIVLVVVVAFGAGFFFGQGTSGDDSKRDLPPPRDNQMGPARPAL